MKVCPTCRRSNEDDASFCAGCGAFLDWTQADAVADAGGAPPVVAPRGPVAPPPPEPPPPQVPPRAATPPAQAPPPPAPAAALAATPRTARSAEDRPRRTAVDAAMTLAERRGRPDLVERLRTVRSDLQHAAARVSVVGEFKKGKSALVNALVGADVCPVHTAMCTVVPVHLRSGDPLEVVVVPREGQARPVDPATLHDWTSEAGNPGNVRDLARVEVRLPRRLLAAGLELVDTPGVGGLDSAQGRATLGTLAASDAALFVTDCSQELTAPELDFLARARERCRVVACVMTKRDLYGAADRIVERNRAHLAAAGLGELPVVAVSCPLHVLAVAEGRPDVEDESGFAALYALLHAEGYAPVRTRLAGQVRRAVEDVVDELEIGVRAELRALAVPAEGKAVVHDLEQARARVQRARAPDAAWQQALNDGLTSLSADADFDLRSRLRAVVRTAEGHVDATAGTPEDDTAYEAWLRREVADAVLGHYDLLRERAGALAEAVAERFGEDDPRRGVRVDLGVDTSLSFLEQVFLPTAPAAATSHSVVRRVLTTVQGSTSGAVMAGTMFTLVNASPLAFVTLPVALFMGGRALLDDRERQRQAHHQERKRLAARYVDEVSFVVTKESRDTLRELQRRLRAHFTGQAASVDRTLEEAATGAARAASLPAPEAERARVALGTEAAALTRLRTSLPAAS